MKLKLVQYFSYYIFEIALLLYGNCYFERPLNLFESMPEILFS